MLATLTGCLTLVFASCSTKNTTDYGSTATPTSPTTSSTPPAGPAAASASITIPTSDVYGATAFTPANATIAVGGTVTWRNNDAVTHTSVSSAWTGQIAPGTEYTRTFAAAGTYPYKCTIHAGMTGTITVQ